MAPGLLHRFSEPLRKDCSTLKKAVRLEGNGDAYKKKNLLSISQLMKEAGKCLSWGKPESLY